MGIAINSGVPDTLLMCKEWYFSAPTYLSVEVNKPQLNEQRTKQYSVDWVFNMLNYRLVAQLCLASSGANLDLGVQQVLDR